MKNSLRKKRTGVDFQNSCALILDKLDTGQAALLDKANKVKEPRKRYSDTQKKWWEFV